DTELQPDDIVVDRNLALVMVVGEGMKETIGITQKASTALGEAKVNIEMINQGSSEVSLLFGIKSNDLHRAIKSLYRAFFDYRLIKSRAIIKMARDFLYNNFLFILKS